MANESKAAGLFARRAAGALPSQSSKADAAFARRSRAEGATDGGRADRLFRRIGKVRDIDDQPASKAGLTDTSLKAGSLPATPGSDPHVAGRAASNDSAAAGKVRAAAVQALTSTTRAAATRTLLRQAKTDSDLRAALLDQSEALSTASLSTCVAKIVDDVWREQEEAK